MWLGSSICARIYQDVWKELGSRLRRTRHSWYLVIWNLQSIDTGNSSVSEEGNRYTSAMCRRFLVDHVYSMLTDGLFPETLSTPHTSLLHLSHFQLHLPRLHQTPTHYLLWVQLSSTPPPAHLLDLLQKQPMPLLQYWTAPSPPGARQQTGMR